MSSARYAVRNLSRAQYSPGEYARVVGEKPKSIEEVVVLLRKILQTTMPRGGPHRGFRKEIDLLPVVVSDRKIYDALEVMIQAGEVVTKYIGKGRGKWYSLKTEVK